MEGATERWRDWGRRRILHVGQHSSNLKFYFSALKIVQGSI
jgi:hypothetical protein